MAQASARAAQALLSATRDIHVGAIGIGFRDRRAVDRLASAAGLNIINSNSNINININTNININITITINTN